jgi:hypothetical protein
MDGSGDISWCGTMIRHKGCDFSVAALRRTGNAELTFYLSAFSLPYQDHAADRGSNVLAPDSSAAVPADKPCSAR